MQQHNITDCFFDLYGTLVDIHTDEEDIRVWEKTRSEIFHFGEGCLLNAEELKKEYISTQSVNMAKMLEKSERGACPEIDIYYVFESMLAKCGIEPKKDRIVHIAEEFRSASTRHCRMYAGALDFLESLKKRRIRLWLISNAQSLFTRPELKILTLDKVFDGIYISSEMGYKKPDSRMFTGPIRDNGLIPEEIVMIGNDGTSDMAGAAKCGLRTIYFRTECSPANDRVKADLILEGPDYGSAYKWIV